MSDQKPGQVELNGIVKSVEAKTYGDGKSFQVIRIEGKGFNDIPAPYEVKAFKVSFDAVEGSDVSLLCWVSGKYGNGTYSGRVFMDLTLADWGYNGVKPKPETATEQAQVPQDESLPF